MSTSKRERVNRLVNEVLPKTGCSLRYTDLLEYKMMILTNKPIKQRYYSVSEKSSMRCTHKWLNYWLKAWSSPVMMMRKFPTTGKSTKCQSSGLTQSWENYPERNIFLWSTSQALITRWKQKKKWRKYTAFIIPNWGLFQWMRLLIGLEGCRPPFFQ